MQPTGSMFAAVMIAGALLMPARFDPPTPLPQRPSCGPSSFHTVCE